MKTKILNIALEIFSQKGYENTSIDEIAKKVGITKPAIYYYFKNKRTLYNEIFIFYFQDLEFKLDLKDYIFKMGTFFIKNPQIAKLFSKELSNEMKNLDQDTILVVSKTLKTLTKILKNKNVNPFFIQTLIVASFTTYLNTLNLRKRIFDLMENENLLVEFDVIEEIYKTIKLYIELHS